MSYYLKEKEMDRDGWIPASNIKNFSPEDQARYQEAVRDLTSQGLDGILTPGTLVIEHYKSTACLVLKLYIESLYYARTRFRKEHPIYICLVLYNFAHNQVMSVTVESSGVKVPLKIVNSNMKLGEK